MSLLPHRGTCFHCGHDHGEGMGSPHELELMARIGELEKELAALRASAPAQPTVPAVMLKRDTDGVCEVSLEIEGRWVRVIRDAGDIISHIVEPIGIQLAIAAAAPVAQGSKEE